jgi:type IV secretion system protein VirB10
MAIKPSDVEMSVNHVSPPKTGGLKIPKNLFIMIAGGIVLIMGLTIIFEGDSMDKRDLAKLEDEKKEAVAKSIELPATLPAVESIIEDQALAASKQQDSAARAGAPGALPDSLNGSPATAYSLPPLPAGTPPPTQSPGTMEAIKAKEKILASEIFAFSDMSGRDESYNSNAQRSPELKALQDEHDRRLAEARARSEATTKQANEQLAMLTAARAREGDEDKTPREEGSVADNERWLKSQVSNNDRAIEAIPKTRGVFTVRRGRSIPMVTVGDISTAIAGEFRAMVSEDVYDDQRNLTIPRGSEVVGAANSSVRVGQEKVMLAATWLYLPSGAKIPLGGMQGIDPMGTNGVTGEVNNHFAKMFGSALAIGIIDRIANGKSSGVQSYGYGQSSGQGGMTQILVNTANSILRRNQNIPPTIDVEAGTPFSIFVKQDIHVDPSLSGRK